MRHTLRPVLAALLAACGTPATPPSATTVPATAPGDTPTTPTAGAATGVGDGLTPPGWDRGVAGYIPPGSTTMPEASICPPDHAGLGCFSQIPGGTFDMGAQSTDPSAPGYDPQAKPDEGPVHKVTVPAYFMMQNEVIAQHYEACVRAKACSADEILRDSPVATFGGTDGDLPVVGVTWKGAQTYCAAIGARLPTEGEWELAARGVDGRQFAFGNTPRCPGASPTRDEDSEVMNTCKPVMEVLKADMPEAESERLFDKVGATLSPDQILGMCRRVVDLPSAEKRKVIEAMLLERPTPTEVPECTATGPRYPSDVRLRNPEGIDGLSGNVAEWTTDPYVAYPGHAPLPPAPDARVVRGGSWLAETVWEWRGAARMPAAATAKLPDIGFRCVWSPP